MNSFVFNPLAGCAGGGGGLSSRGTSKRAQLPGGGTSHERNKTENEKEREEEGAFSLTNHNCDYSVRPVSGSFCLPGVIADFLEVLLTNFVQLLFFSEPLCDRPRGR